MAEVNNMNKPMDFRSKTEEELDKLYSIRTQNWTVEMCEACIWLEPFGERFWFFMRETKPREDDTKDRFQDKIAEYKHLVKFANNKFKCNRNQVDSLWNKPKPPSMAAYGVEAMMIEELKQFSHANDWNELVSWANTKHITCTLTF